jgi:tetratricopeptide (TPR) repeat protein
MNAGLDATFILGRALERQGRLADADACYRAVRQANPSYPRIGSHLANLLYARDELDEALALAVAAAEAMPSDAIAHFVAARCHAQRNDLDAAENALLALSRTHDLMACQGALVAGRAYWREDAIEQRHIALAYWPLYSSVVARQGWLERAVAESEVSDNLALDVHQPEKRVARLRGTHDGPHVTLVTFGSPAFRPLQERLADSAFALNEIHEVVLWTLADLQATQYYRNHPTLLDRPRGAGFWAWKPYILLRALMEGAEGDYVIYYNCGRGEGNRITTSIQPLLDWCTRQPSGMLPGVRRPVFGPNRHWTKRDCFHFMDCDSAKYWEHPPIGIQVSAWRNTPAVRAFLHEWMKYCLDPRIVSDHANVCGLPNLEGFFDHRQDQSVLTNLAVRHGFFVPEVNSADINDISAALR